MVQHEKERNDSTPDNGYRSKRKGGQFSLQKPMGQEKGFEKGNSHHHWTTLKPYGFLGFRSSAG